MLRVRICGGIGVDAEGVHVPESLFAGRQGRLVFAYLLCERHRSVRREELAELLWPDTLPASWSSSLSAVISKLRRALAEVGLDGASTLASAFGSYRLHLPPDASVDWETAVAAVEEAEAALSRGDAKAAVARGQEAQAIAGRGFLIDDCPWVDAQRERLAALHVRALQCLARAHLFADERGRAVLAAREALALDELRESSYRLLMQALASAGERGEALRVFERCRVMLAEELGADPDPETEAVYLQVLGADAVAPDTVPAPPVLPTGVVTFLLTDVVGSTELWDTHPAAMALALERHDRLAAEVIAAHGGALLKPRLEGDATVSVFPRASVAVLSALALHEAFAAEPWPEGAAIQVRIAIHTGEAIERDGDYFGPALNRAARLRGLAGAGQILVSQAVAEVVRDHLPDGTGLRPLGEHQLRGLSRGEFVFQLGEDLEGADGNDRTPLERPPMPAPLTGGGPFVGRKAELAALAADWAVVVEGRARGILLAGEPGVGKTRLAGEWAAKAYEQGALVLYGRCDEDLGAPYQPFAEALRVLVPRLGPSRLRAVRGIEELRRLVPEIDRDVPNLPTPTQGDPETERYVLFDAVARLLAAVSVEVPLVLVADDLQWAAKPTLLLLRHVLRTADRARLQIVGTYRSTDLDPAHPLSATLVDLHHDGTAERVTLSGLGEDDLSAYVSATGCDDEHLASVLSSVTAGNPFFFIEVLRHVADSGGAWDRTTLPQGVRDAVGRRLTRLSAEANEALLVGAVAGASFSVDLVEHVLERDLVDAVEEAAHAGIVLEESGGRFRFTHALVRQSLLTTVASVRRVRLHKRIAEVLEATPPSEEGMLLADLAYHWFECAWAGSATKAVEACRRAGEHAMSRLGYEAAADFFERALQASELEGPSGADEERAQLAAARCEALLAAGDATSAAGAVAQLDDAAGGSARWSAWATCFSAELATVVHPERLDHTEQAVAAAAEQLAALGDDAGEAEAHTVRSRCLARLGRVADCEAALDRALTAARRAGDPRRINAVLAGAPLAALWGPSPVARASGRCLDVVRVLRITTGSPAVEAAALRSQAVLEAMRGRFDAARRMLASARSSLESLGHAHALLETDLSAGIVELTAGDAPAAEQLLRAAHQGFVSRGVGVDAAQAAALLARAVLAQGRVEEALELTRKSELLAGVDLKAAIAWRAARAEALARLGRMALALEVAHAAAALAAPTDALIDQADAHLSLAVVLHAAGQPADAYREARSAIELYERKGATARASVVEDMVPSATAPAEWVPAAAPIARRRVRPNLATVANRDTFVVDDVLLAALPELFREDFVGVDHPMQLVLDREEMIASFQEMSPDGRGRFSQSMLASLGERHCLARVVYTLDAAPDSSPGASEIVFLNVCQVDAGGRFQRFEQFDPDELHLALARLIELHADDELAPDRGEGRYLIAAQWREHPGRWAETAVLVDHRPQGFADDAQWRATDVLALEEGVSLCEILTEGHDQHGGRFEMFGLTLQVYGRDGRVRRQELYAPEQLDEALARFDELAAPQVLDYRTNDAARRMADIIGSMLAGDWDEVAEATAPDVVLDDRRSIVSYRSEGRDTYVMFLRSAMEAGLREFDMTPVATRGSRLVLSRNVLRGEGFEAEHLTVAEVDAGGRAVAGVVFDPDDVGAAFAELDRRYLAGEAAPFAREWALVTSHFDAFNRHDWNTFETLTSGDHGLVDHRLASFGDQDEAEMFANARLLVDQVPDATFRIVAVPRLTAGGGVYVAQVSGHDTHGGVVEDEWLVLAMANDDVTQRRRTELFPTDNLAGALARFDDLAAPAVPRYLENDAFLRLSQFVARMLGGDWDAIAAGLAPDVVLDDRRSIVMYRAEGREAYLSFLRSVHEIGVTGFDVSPIATRGDRLLLTHNFLEGDGFETENISVSEFGAHGQLLGGVAFDPDDLDAAFAELDARYLAGEAAPFDENWARVMGHFDAFNRRDWSRFESLAGTDHHLVDHRLASFGNQERADIHANARLLVDQVPDATFRVVAVPRLAAGGGVCVVCLSGHDTLGGVVEDDWLVLAISDYGATHGRLSELYATDDLPAALARFEELTGPAVPHYLTNEALLSSARMVERILASDWEAVADATAPDVVLDDRRSVVGYRTEGRDAYVSYVRSFAEAGVTGWEMTPVATRGGYLVLSHNLARGDGFDGESLSVVEVDPDGRYLGGVAFDPGDVDAAFDELDARYMAGEAAPFADVARAIAKWGSAERDWESFKSSVADDYAFVDHRQASFGELDAAGHYDHVRALLEMVPVVSIRVVAFPRITSSGGVAVLGVTGVDAEGGAFEISVLAVAIVAGDKLRRMEMFPVVELPAAVKRFEELTTGPRTPAYVQNAATRHSERAFRLALAGDWEGFATTIDENVVFDDRRPVIGTRVEGRGPFLAMMQTGLGFGVSEAERVPLATRGDRRALARAVYRGDGFEVEMLEVIECGADGRSLRVCLFDPADLDAAFAELDAWYAADDAGQTLE